MSLKISAWLVILFIWAVIIAVGAVDCFLQQRLLRKNRAKIKTAVIPVNKGYSSFLNALLVVLPLQQE